MIWLHRWMGKRRFNKLLNCDEQKTFHGWFLLGILPLYIVCDRVDYWEEQGKGNAK